MEVWTINPKTGRSIKVGGDAYKAVAASPRWRGQLRRSPRWTGARSAHRSSQSAKRSREAQLYKMFNIKDEPVCIKEIKRVPEVLVFDLCFCPAPHFDKRKIKKVIDEVAAVVIGRISMARRMSPQMKKEIRGIIKNAWFVPKMSNIRIIYATVSPITIDRLEKVVASLKKAQPSELSAGVPYFNEKGTFIGYLATKAQVAQTVAAMKSYPDYFDEVFTPETEAFDEMVQNIQDQLETVLAREPHRRYGSDRSPKRAHHYPRTLEEKVVQQRGRSGRWR